MLGTKPALLTPDGSSIAYSELWVRMDRLSRSIDTRPDWPAGCRGGGYKRWDGLRLLQPCGPYLLSGHCYGGIVAFEMACQLPELGDTVDLLALFDTPTPG